MSNVENVLRQIAGLLPAPVATTDAPATTRKAEKTPHQKATDSALQRVEALLIRHPALRDDVDALSPGQALAVLERAESRRKRTEKLRESVEFAALEADVAQRKLVARANASLQTSIEDLRTIAAADYRVRLVKAQVQRQIEAIPVGADEAGEIAKIAE